MNHCHRFVAQLLALADAALASPDRQARAHHLAVALVTQFVPEAKVAGHDIRRVLVGQATGEAAMSADYPDILRGFKPELVAGGQDVEALRHFAAAAAAVLEKKRYLIGAAIAADAGQVLTRGHVKEACAEIRDDRAGARAGDLLARYLGGELVRAEVRRQLRELLCQNSRAKRSGNQAPGNSSRPRLMR